MKDVTGYLKQQQSNSPTPELASEWHALEDVYNKRYKSRKKCQLAASASLAYIS